MHTHTMLRVLMITAFQVDQKTIVFPAHTLAGPNEPEIHSKVFKDLVPTSQQTQEVCITPKDQVNTC